MGPFRLYQDMEELSEVFLFDSSNKGYVQNPQYTDYFNLVINNPAFVDKTLLIKTFLEDKSKGALITAPSGFGKTSNILMLKTFLEIRVDDNGVPQNIKDTRNYKLFVEKNLNIAKENKFLDEHLGKYPVIHVECNPAEKIYNNIRTFYNACADHKYLVNSSKLNEEEIKNAELTDVSINSANILKVLAELLYRHFERKVVVLIDAYDSFFIKKYKEQFAVFDYPSNFDDVEAIITCMNSEAVERVFITATHHAPSTCFSEVQYLKKYPFWEDHLYHPFLGLSTKEMNMLFDKLKVNCDAVRYVYKNLKGYYSLKGTVTYNTLSILKFLEKQSIDFNNRVMAIPPHLELDMIIEKTMNAPFKNLIHTFVCRQIPMKVSIKHNPNQADLRNLKYILDGEEWPLSIKENESINIFFSFLFEIGVFTLDPNQPYKNKNGYTNMYVKIPNLCILRDVKDEIGCKI